MPRRTETPPIDPIEGEFMSAIDRLIQGAPKSREALKRAKAGTLRIDKLTVAAEAGRSRTTLYKYPKVIARIEVLGKGTATTAHDIIASLREENRLLKRQRQEAMDAMVARCCVCATSNGTDAAIRKAVRESTSRSQQDGRHRQRLFHSSRNDADHSIPLQVFGAGTRQTCEKRPMAANMLRKVGPIIGRGIEIFFGWQGQNARRRASGSAAGLYLTKAVRGQLKTSGRRSSAGRPRQRARPRRP